MEDVAGKEGETCAYVDELKSENFFSSMDLSSLYPILSPFVEIPIAVPYAL